MFVAGLGGLLFGVNVGIIPGALFNNIAVSTTIAGVFLPTRREYCYATMFFIFAGCRVVHFITAAFFLPETKGKTLEEIEDHFEGKK